jgi:hypothetical protein
VLQFLLNRQLTRIPGKEETCDPRKVFQEMIVNKSAEIFSYSTYWNSIEENFKEKYIGNVEGELHCSFLLDIKFAKPFH